MQKRYALLIMLLTVPFSAAACDDGSCYLQVPTAKVLSALKMSKSWWIGRTINWQRIAEQGSVHSRFLSTNDDHSCLYYLGAMVWLHQQMRKKAKVPVDTMIREFTTKVENGNVHVHSEANVFYVLKEVSEQEAEIWQKESEIEKSEKDAHTSCTTKFVPDSFFYDEVKAEIRAQMNEVCDATLPVAEFLAKINSISV